MICFAWDEFPQYAARCVGAFTRSTDERVLVVATSPKVPIRGMENVCGCRVVWIERGEKRSITEIAGEMPRCIFLGGWNLREFVRFRGEIRANGGTVIEMCDGNWTLSPFSPLSWRWWRKFAIECAKAVRFRLLLRHKYDAFFTPGRSGVRLLRFYGVPRERIATGMYTADASLFFDGPPLAKRSRRLIYVGQFIERKNVRRLVQAFLWANTDGDWTLDLYGSGHLKEEIEILVAKSAGCSIRVNGFLQPEELAAKYRDARAFILPSVEEHWGLVVHEAALSGCVLLLGNTIGAAADMLVRDERRGGCRNGFEFNPRSVRDMKNAMRRVMRLTDSELHDAQAASLAAAKNASIDKFVESARAFAGCNRLRREHL